MDVKGLSDSVLSAAVVVIALAGIAAIYFMNAGVTPAVNYATSTTLQASTSTTATTSTTVSSTTIPAPAIAVSSTTATTSTTSTTLNVPTSTTLPQYLQKYAGKGYRIAYMEITFFCPSCVPAVAANLRNEPGVIAKSMSYQQKVSWVIYDPRAVRLDEILMISGGSGEVTLLNDDEI
ncbi:MAG: hypothetical protein NTU61_02215 [Candidatus Altiarchaeota archaeon]|nr:hypothetical protein [Candidatus Altiarchaeota archaeon]